MKSRKDFLLQTPARNCQPKRAVKEPVACLKTEIEFDAQRFDYL